MTRVRRLRLVSVADLKRGAHILRTKGEAAHRKWLKKEMGYAYPVRQPSRHNGAGAMGGPKPTRSKAQHR
jgi:hypothetical protein